jgi:hypothetical protein
MRRAESKRELRERGVYRLPDAREFVVRRSSDRVAYLLYSVAPWTAYTVADYRADAGGRLLSRGTVTRWRVSDLQDTGRTAR